MKYGFMAPRGSLDNKPPHGSPCNRCGLCCMAVLCPLGKHVFKREEGPCPALQRDETDGKPTCGLVAEPTRYATRLSILHGFERMREAALHLIGSGQGCDARFNGEPGSEEFYRRMREHDRRAGGKTNRAKKLWGIP